MQKAKQTLKEIRNELKKENEILANEIKYNRKHLDKIWDNISEFRERLQDVELHINFNTRLLSIICSEKFGMSEIEVRRLVRRIRKLAEAEMQIHLLERLFRKESKKNK